MHMYTVGLSFNSVHIKDGFSRILCKRRVFLINNFYVGKSSVLSSEN